MSEVRPEFNEVLELFNSLKIIAGSAGEVMADGKVDTADLAKLVPLALKINELSEGFKDLDVAMEALKNIKQAEVLAVVNAAYAVVKAFEDGKKKV